MNTNGLLNELKKESQLNGFSFDDIGDDHLYTCNLDTVVGLNK